MMYWYNKYVSATLDKVKQNGLSYGVMKTIFNNLYRFVFPPLMPHQLRAKYGVPIECNVQIEKTEGGVRVVTCDQMPGLITEGMTDEEVLRNFNLAVLSYYDVPKRDADIVFNTMNGRVIGDKKEMVIA